jgi:ATP-binding cassette subfamily B protein/subfamily B ATP-binding cassette protein MsbA
MTGRIAALGALTVVGVGLEALLPWPLKLIIDNVLEAEPLPEYAKWIADLPGAASLHGVLGWLAFAVLLVFLGVQAIHLVKSVLGADLAARLRLALGARVFDRLQTLSLAYHRRALKGDLLRRVTSDSGCLATIVADVLLQVLASTLLLVVLFTIMWQLDSTLALIAVSVALPMGVMMQRLGPRMTERAYEHEEAEGAVWAVAEQTLTAIPVVQGFGRAEHEESRFRGMADRSIQKYVRTLRTQIQFRVGVDACQALGMAAIMLIGGYHVLGARTSVGTLVLFMSYVTALYAPLVAIAYMAMTVATASGSATRVAQILDSSDEIGEPSGAAPLRHVTPRGVRGHVQLEGIVFGYEPGRSVLRDIDIEARAGETLALAGPTGAGKSTLASLIPRFCDPWEGRVLIDRQDVRGATLASVRDSVALVPQDPFLLPMSVADNIAYGRPSATRAEVEAAARQANAEEFIRQLPRGFDTVIGERGVTLSGGQRQRLAIARALLKDAPILIMDEPTSALDADTERLVLEALDRLTSGRTTIIIAHRLSTVRRADRIVVLDQGRLAETGTHQQLLAAGGLYRKLYVSQTVAGTVG